MKSLNPWWEYIFMMCHRMGRPPISIIGFGLRWLSSEMRVPRPPARITVFMRLSSVPPRRARLIVDGAARQNPQAPALPRAPRRAMGGHDPQAARRARRLPYRRRPEGRHDGAVRLPVRG